MNDYPGMIAPENHIEPVPRRVRAELAGQVILDTIQALYVWEFPNYPQFYIPITDVNADAIFDENTPEESSPGSSRLHGLRVGQIVRPGSAHVYAQSPIDGVAGTVRFEWDALDKWFEEDEEVFVHPRNPYTRVDALRSLRHVRVELDGVTLAESSMLVMVFETGLPTRYYFNPTQVNWEHLVPTNTVSECPYKGRTSNYWSIRVNDTLEADLAWAYNFPTRQLLPIAGLVAFYNEKVDILVDGELLDRPKTHLIS